MLFLGQMYIKISNYTLMGKKNATGSSLCY